MPRSDSLICLSCGFGNLSVAVFCGDCGQLLDGIPCQTCGSSNPRNNRFCDQCGSHIVNVRDEMAPQAPSSPNPAFRAPQSAEINLPEPASRAHPRQQLPTIRTFLAVPASLGAVLSARKAHLLAAGAVAVILAQLGLYFSVELNTNAPSGYLLLLAVGVGLFALGSFGIWWSRSPTGSHSPESLPAPASATPPVYLRPGFRAAGLLVGAALMAMLLSLLAAGSESGRTLLIWIAALAAFAAFFTPRVASVPTHSLAPLMAWLHLHRWDVLLVATLMGVFLAVNVYDLQHWYYSAIGDEYLFYEHAKRIVDEGIVRPFSQEGVYNTHPVINSVFQAAVMRVFGADYFGWTFSEVLNAALTIPAIYVIGRILGGRSAAVTAAAIFAFSHYIFAFSHTGYTNLSPLPVTAWALALFVLGWRHNNPLFLYAAGVVAGLGFYTHYSGRAIIPVILLFAIAAGRPKRMGELWPLALGFVLTVAPTFVVEQEGVLTRMFGQVVGGYSEVVTGSVGQRLLNNIVVNLPAFNYNASVHTYVYGPLLDPVSGILAALGIAFAMGHIRQTAYRLLLIWFAVAIFMTGVLSPYPHVAITRLVFAVPPVALLAGLLVGRLFGAMPDGGTRAVRLSKPTVLVATFGVLLPLILLLNLWQFWHVTPRVTPHSQEAVALGAFRSYECAGDTNGTVFVGHATGEGTLLRHMLAAFYPDGPLPRQSDYIDLAEGAELPDTPLKCVIFVNPDAPEAFRLQNELAGRYPDGRLTSFANPSGTTTVEVFSRR